MVRRKLRQMLQDAIASSGPRSQRHKRNRSGSRQQVEFLEDRSLLSAGAIDTSFGANGTYRIDLGTVSEGAARTVVQQDGKIVTAGSAKSSGNWDFVVARFLPDGGLDTSFGDGGKKTIDFGMGDDFAESLVLQADGKILVVGEMSNGSNYDVALVRLTDAGQLDNSFSTDGMVSTPFGSGHDNGRELALGPGGTIYVAGDTAQASSDMMILKYDSSGVLVNSFGTGGKMAIDYGSLEVANSIAVQSNGNVVVSGFRLNNSDFDFAVARVSGTTGQLDSNFGTAGKFSFPVGTSHDYSASMVMLPNESFVMAGFSAAGSKDNFAIAKVTASGQLDSSFGTSGITTVSVGSGNDRAQSMTVQPDGKLLVAGLTTTGSNLDMAIVRLTAAGAVDTSFDADGKQTIAVMPQDDLAYSVAMQGIYKAILVGTSHNGTKSATTLARIVTADNSAPADIALSANTVAENQPVGTTVGAFSSTDANSGEAFAYSLVSGTGSADNASFQIVGNQLRTNAAVDYEQKTTYSIRVRSTDRGGLSFEEVFTVNVTDLIDTPPVVTATSFLTSGTLTANATSLSVTFSQPVFFSLGSQERPAASALQIKLANPSAADGIYWIDPDGAGAIAPFQVYCDMTTDGGGWMLAVNSILGSEPASNDITSNTGTVGLATPQTRNLNTYFAGTATADVRHEIDGSNVGQGRFHGKYTADVYQAPFTGVTTLSGHSNSALLQGSFNAPFGSNPGGVPWFYNGNPQTTIPASPGSGSPGPLYVQTGQILNSYRIWIRSGVAASGPAIGGAELASNYELRRAGADGLLGNSDDPIITINGSTVSGNTATLNFAALPEDVYRLTVKDTITNSAGNALDGDANGTAGGNWRKDFVVGALTTSLTSPNGFVFDPEFGGVGAGQLVQGTGNAFDGLGRLSVDGASIANAASVTNALSSTTLVSTTTATLTSGSIPGLGTFTAPMAGTYLVSGFVHATQIVSDTSAWVWLNLNVNGVPVYHRAYSLVAPYVSTNYSFAIDHPLQLSVGSIVSLSIIKNDGIAAYFNANGLGSAGLRVDQVNEFTGSGPALTVMTSVTNTTATLAPSENVVPGLSPLTMPTAGTYYVRGHVSLVNLVRGDNYTFLSIYVNGLQRRDIPTRISRQAIYFSVDINAVLQLAAGDIVDIRMYTDSNNMSYHALGMSSGSLHVEKINPISSVGPALTLTNNVTTTEASLTPNVETTVPVTYTAPTDGVYRVVGNVILRAVSVPGAFARLGLYSNGVLRQVRIYNFRDDTGESVVYSFDVDDVLTLSAGSNLELRILTNAPASFESLSLGVPSASVLVEAVNSVTAPTIGDGGHTIVIPSSNVVGLTTSRNVTIPSSGTQDVARSIDTFTNSTSVSIMTPVRVVGNLGSDAATTVFATSDGDLLVEPTDLWFGTDDADGSGSPAIIHLLHGPFGLQPTSVNVIEDNVEWTYSLTVAAGETKRLASFTVLGTTRAEAIAAANTLVTNTGFGGEAAAFLTNDELLSLANFQFNRPPAEVVLSGNTVAENLPAGTTVGSLSTSDPNSGDTFTYSLVSGTGDADNALFTLSGNSVLTAAAFDFESRSSYSIRVRSTDAGGLWTEGVFTVTVLNQLEGTAGNDNFVLTYTSTTVSVTVASVGKPVTSLGSFPLETPLRLAGLGGTDSVRIVTTAGNDTIATSNSGLVINGCSLSLDSIEAIVLAGGAGNDTYRFDADSFIGLVSLDDAAGLETLDFSATTTTGITINLGVATNQAVNANLSLNLKSISAFDSVIGGAGSDVILGNAVANLLSGGSGNDTINGGSGNDTLSGNGGDDSLDGGAGNDVYRFDADFSLGTDILTDASGTELLDFSTTSAAVSLNLGATLVQTVNENLSIQLTSSTTFDNVTGGEGNDIITGNAGINTLVGSGGNDSLDGAAGNDIYLFDADSPLGSDVLTDAVGTELISFAGTSASVTVNLGITTVQTVNGFLELTLLSLTQFDNILGGDGNDSLTGNSLINSLTGGAGNDTLAGAAGNDTYVFDADTALGTDTIDEIIDAGIDTLSFSLTTTKTVTASLGLTTTQTVNSNLSLNLTSGAALEKIVAGTFGSVLTGNALGNVLTGGNGADLLDGGSGNDSLNGGAGNDTLIGGFGNDVLTDAAGDDSMQGGFGDDRYIMDTDAALGANTIDEAAGGIDTLEFSLTTTQTIVLSLATTGLQVVNPNLTLTLVSGIYLENVLGGSLDDIVTGNLLNNTLTGNAGHDVLNGGEGDDLLIGGAGNDTLNGGLHSDVYKFDADLTPGLGTDLVSDTAGTDALDFSLTTTLGLTLLDLTTTTTQVLNANHSLVLQPGTIIESVLGTAKNDVIIGNAADNILVGNAGNDQLEGGDGRDILIGGLGADILLGGNDDDLLIAGRTSSDSLLRNLNDLRTEWISENSYDARTDNLFAGVGTTGTSLKAKINVLNDAGAKDTVTGSAGEDWFFRALDDVLVDLFAGEQLDLL